MNFIFLILKILWVILQIIFYLLLFVLFLVLVILFTNFKYNFKANTKNYYVDDDNSKNSLDFNFRLTYLLKILKVYCNKKDDKIKVLIKVFSKVIYKDTFENSKLDNLIYNNPTVKEEEKEKEKENLKEESKTSYSSKSEVKTSTVTGDESVKTSKVENKSEKEVKVKKQKVKQEKIKKNKKEETKKETETEEKNNSFFESLKNKDTIVRIFKATIKFLKRLKPNKFTVRLKFGFEDPSLTGKVLGAIYAIKGITNLDIEPVGEFNEVIEPNIYINMNGKVSLIKLISPYFFIIWLYIKYRFKNTFSKDKGE